MFQSSPTPKGGRYIMQLVEKSVFHGFNPHPPRRVGATYYRGFGASSGFVSILTHPEGWALLPRPLKQWRTTTFQSSPTPKGGRYAVRTVRSQG